MDNAFDTRIFYLLVADTRVPKFGENSIYSTLFLQAARPEYTKFTREEVNPQQLHALTKFAPTTRG